MNKEELKQKYSFLKPMPGYIVLKEVEDENNGKILVKSGNLESRAYGYVVSIPENETLHNLKVGDLVCYNEYEGQELFKYGKVTEDHIIVIKWENILLLIDESNV